MREWFLFIFIHSFILLFLLSIRIHHKTNSQFSFRQPKHDITHRESGSNKLTQKRPKLNVLFLSHYDAFSTLRWNIRVDRSSFLTRGVEIRVRFCKWVRVARVILTAVIISQSRLALPIVLGHDHLVLLLLVRSPKLLERLLQTPHVSLLLLFAKTLQQLFLSLPNPDWSGSWKRQSSCE